MRCLLSLTGVVLVNVLPLAADAARTAHSTGPGVRP